jgi:sigma-B regulation protein RsbU (phosphoserine phosphatase)
VLLVTSLIGVMAVMRLVLDPSVITLPSAWLLILVSVGALLGGWRVGLMTTAIGAFALWLILADREAVNPLSTGSAVWGVMQFLLAGGSVSVALGAMDRTIREMRNAARALQVSEKRATQVTGRLQQAILPADPPDIPGLDVAARYLAADVSEVGGDFYDWYRSNDDTWYLQIGDVCGKGPAAASRALLARYTLRTAAMLDGDPIRMLFALNSAVLAERDERYCTAAVLRLAFQGSIEASIALGGHPHPLILRDDEVHTFGMPGSLVGLFDQIELNCDRTDLRPGDRLFLYTDGVTDRASAPIEDTQLHDLLLELNHLPLDDFATALEQRLLATPGGRDDIAFVLIGVRAD